MTTRIQECFGQIRAANRPALVTFTMGFDPDRETSLKLLHKLVDAGVDVLEIGVPFSDPMADGPTIQAAGLRALEAGSTLAGILALVREFRQTNRHTPVVLMGYFNPIFIYGAERFAQDAKDAGVDGAIVVDLPLEEMGELDPVLNQHGIALIRLITPTTDDARFKKLTAGAHGFLYYVSVAGVTGQRQADNAELSARLAHLQAMTDLPVVVGFGIRSPEQAKALSATRGMVIGSAIVDRLHREGAEEAIEFIKGIVHTIK